MKTVQRRGRVLLAFLLLSSLLQGLVIAQETKRSIELFSPAGERQSHAIIDTLSGRVDIFDTGYNRIGWGKVRPGGQVDIFDLKGNRLETWDLKRLK